jgi:hypothetical protein
MLTLALLAGVLTVPEPGELLARAQAEAPRWTYDWAPYYWSASLSGNIAIDGQDVDIEGGSGDGSSGETSLYGYLGHFEAHHGPWSFVFAPIFIKYDVVGSQPPANDAAVTIKAQVHEAFVAREFAAGWEWMAGARYQLLETELDLSSGGVPLSSHASSRNWTDPIVGLRYHTALGGDWSLHARADIGGFGVGSDFAWNASVISQYQFTKLFGMTLGYRALSIDFEDQGPSGRIAYDLAMYGPILGISLSF